MSRFAAVSVLVVVPVAFAGAARAEGAGASDAEIPSEGAAQSSGDETETDPTEGPLPGKQELGGAVGVAFGGRTTPGGLRIAGDYLYRLAARDWFDARIAFTFGSGDEACFRDREDDVLCDHGFASGFAAEVLTGVARYLRAQEAFSPFVRGGVGVRVVAFPGDDLRGLALPLWAGAGVRARVHEGVAVVGGAEARAGPAWMDRGVGLEPHLSFAITAGVDFTLD